jgi:hypothetical protein
MIINLLETEFFFINLNEDTGKNQKILGLLCNLGIKLDKIKRVNAIRASGIPQDSVFLGCFLSQLKALKLGRELNRPFVILEDDVCLNKFEAELELPEDSQCVYLGISSWSLYPSKDSNLAKLGGNITDYIDPKICRIFNMLSSHSIMYIDMNYVDKLIRELESNLSGNSIFSAVENIPMKYFGSDILPCDVIMANCQYYNRIYALRNPIFYQEGKHQYCTLFKL